MRRLKFYFNNGSEFVCDNHTLTNEIILKMRDNCRGINCRGIVGSCHCPLLIGGKCIGNHQEEDGKNGIKNIVIMPEHSEYSLKISELLNTMDAAVWAKEFCSHFATDVIDQGLMIGWFSNAIMAAHDIVLRREEDKRKIHVGEYYLVYDRMAHGAEPLHVRILEENRDGSFLYASALHPAITGKALPQQLYKFKIGEKKEEKLYFKWLIEFKEDHLKEQGYSEYPSYLDDNGCSTTGVCFSNRVSLIKKLSEGKTKSQLEKGE